MVKEGSEGQMRFDLQIVSNDRQDFANLYIVS